MSKKPRRKSKSKGSSVEIQLKKHLENYQKEINIKEKIKKNSRTKSKRKYNNDHYSLLQVYLDKKLVEQFKKLCLELGESQASIIREYLEDFISSFK